jgi:putative colanic acid biosynthesis UDP-glucose lipid carrier transferase
MANNTFAHDVSTHDSEYVFIVKSLFYPTITVIFLTVCLWLGQRPLVGAYFLVVGLAFIGVAEFLEVSDVLRAESLQRKLLCLLNIAARWVGIGIGMTIVLYLSGLGGVLHDGVIIFWFVSTPLILWCGAIGVRHLLLHMGLKHRQPRRAVVVGKTEAGLLLSTMLRNEPLLGIKSLGIFTDHDNDDDEAELLPNTQAVLGRLDDVARFVREQNVQVVYITLPMSRTPQVLQLLDALNDTIASVYFVPNFIPLQHLQARFDVVHGIPLIAVCETPFYGVRGLVKRCVDVVIATGVLITLSPLLIGIAIGVRLSSKGPAMYKQRRYGLDGREIMIYKFRSMSVSEDGATSYTQVTRDDSRVTRFGALLRRTSCDELPQFFNVLEGTMSVVGPRPHAIAVNEHYRSLIPSYMIRHKIKPGITGWAQVNGYRGGDDLPSMTKRIECDLHYLANWSLALDLRILLQTVSLVWIDRRAY